MKIIYVSNAVLPSQTANSINVMKMCSALAGLGHDVELLAPAKKTAPALAGEDIFGFYNVAPSFRIKKLPWWPVPGKGYLYAVLACLDVIKKKPDMVYSRNIAASGLISFWGVPTICELHDALEKKAGLEQCLIKEAYKHSKRFGIVAITHALSRHLASYFNVPERDICVAADGADPVNTDDIIPDAVEPSDTIKIGYIGSLYKGKGLEVVGALSERIDKAVFHVVGGTEEQVEEGRKKFPKVIFHGFKRQSQIPSFLAAFDIVLLPNQSVVEVHGGGGNIAEYTSPLKAFEYMASGKAIVASDLPALKEIFVHGQNALLCPPESIGAWEAAVYQMIEDSELRSALGRTAKSDFLENYTWAKRAEQILIWFKAT